MDLKCYRITIGELLQNQNACSLLQKELPFVINSPLIWAAKSVPLCDVVEAVQRSGNFFYQQKLNSILQKLARL